jgi:hypothetical protein
MDDKIRSMNVILVATVNDLNNQHTASCCNFPSMRASGQAMSYSISTLLRDVKEQVVAQP